MSAIPEIMPQNPYSATTDQAIELLFLAQDLLPYRDEEAVTKSAKTEIPVSSFPEDIEELMTDIFGSEVVKKSVVVDYLPISTNNTETKLDVLLIQEEGLQNTKRELIKKYSILPDKDDFVWISGIQIDNIPPSENSNAPRTAIPANASRFGRRLVDVKPTRANDNPNAHALGLSAVNRFEADEILKYIDGISRN